MDNDAYVSSAWVNQHLAHPSLVLVDVRLPNYYGQAHIPGAVNFPPPLLGFGLGPVGGEPPAATLARHLGQLGVTRDLHVVAYDDGRSADAARLFWALGLYRHPRVSLLDGGITKWLHDGYDWQDTAVVPTPAVYLPGDIDRDVLATFEEVRAALGDPNTVIVDVRSPAEFLGLDVRAQRAGHIPGAINVDWTNTLEGDENGITCAAPEEDLVALYTTGSVTPDKTVIVHCQSGGRSSATYAALKRLGYADVRNYLGGWGEWGNRWDTPVEEGR